MDFVCQATPLPLLAFPPIPKPVLNGRYQAGRNSKQSQIKIICPFYIVVQVLKPYSGWAFSGLLMGRGQALKERCQDVRCNVNLPDICLTQIFKIDCPNRTLFFQKNRLLNKMISKNQVNRRNNFIEKHALLKVLITF